MKKKPFDVLRVIQLILSLAILAMQGFIIYKTAEASRLLAGFQRIDTVKDAEKACSYPRPIDGMPLCEVRVRFSDPNASPLYMNKQHHLTSCHTPKGEGCDDDTASDPNICYHWSSDCHDGECDSICRLKPEVSE